MSAFDRLDRMASRTIDWLNGENFTLLPMRRSPNGRLTADPDRPTISGKGVFDERASKTAIQFADRKQSAGNDTRTVLSDRTPEFNVDLRVFEGVDGELIEDSLVRQGDFIRLDDRAGTPLFYVSGPQPDGPSRIRLTLKRS